MTKIILIFSGIALIIIAALFFNKIDNSDQVSDIEDNQSTNLTISENIQSISKSGSLITLIEGTGQIHIFNTQELKYLKDQLINLPNVASLFRSRHPENLIYYSNSITKPGWFYFNLKTRREVKLNDRILAPTISADGQRLLYVFINENQSKSIVTADIDGQNFTRVFQTEANYEVLSWGNKASYALGLNASSIPPSWNLIYLGSKKEQPITNGYGEALWSPNGDHVIVDGRDNVEIINVDEASSRILNSAQSVSLTTWTDNEKLITYRIESNNLQLFNTNSQLIKEIDWPIDPPERLIGAEEDRLYYLRENTFGYIDISPIFN